MEKLRLRLQEIYGDRKWIIASQAAVSAGPIHTKLGEWGADTLVVAANEGTGEVPDTGITYTHSRGDTILESIRRFYQSVEHPSSHVQRAVDRYDPGRRARVITEPHAIAREMVGRSTFGVRKPTWSAWEDKMRVDRLWDELGVARARYRIVDVKDAPEAADDLAADLGTVWAADNSSGWHGGGELVHWVVDPGRYQDEVAWFAKRAAQVRVMPFLDGLPCSIHGWVTVTGVAVFLPVEILILRHADMSGFEYAGVATLWAAPESVSESMRAVSRKVGEHLARVDDYIGPYGIDGVLTPNGFLPTELNPRMSAGAGVQLGSVDLPLGLLMRAEVEGLVEVDHAWLEQTALDQRKPVFHFGKMVTEVVRDSFSVTMGLTGTVEEASSEGDSMGKITAGPSATGSYIMGDFDVEKMATGEPVGSLVADSLNLAVSKWDIALPEVVAAPNVYLGEPEH